MRDNTIYHVTKCAVVLYIALVACASTGAYSQDISGEKSCNSNDNFFQLKKRAQAKSFPSSAKRYAYAAFAEFLADNIGSRSSFCGFDKHNILYFIRQSTSETDIKIGDSFQNFSNITIKRILTRAFQNGELGLPRNKRLSRCWFTIRNDEVHKCERLEYRVTCKFDRGERPKGYKEIRDEVDYRRLTQAPCEPGH
jgi:hypothetical protein